MPRVVNSFGDRGRDEEIDRLWAEIDALKKAPPATGTKKVAPTVFAPAGDLEVRQTNLAVDAITSVLEFDQADGFSLSQTADAVKVNIAVSPSGAAGGDLTGTYPNPTIGTNKVTLGQMAQLAQSLILGRASGAGTGNVTGLTASQVKTILDFDESVDDRVAALLVAGSGITLTYSDGANTLTVAASGGGGGITFSYQSITTSATLTSSSTAVYICDFTASGATLDLPSPATHLLPVFVTGINTALTNTLRYPVSGGGTTSITINTAGNPNSNLILISDGLDYHVVFNAV